MKNVTLASVLIAVLSGCGGIGPRTVTHDRFDYTDTIAKSWQQQMLIMRSKSLFTFIMFVFSLTETQGREGAPIVTIPAG